MNSYNECKAIVELDLDPIKVKLMHKESGEGWTLEQASLVEAEYRRFLYLIKTFPDEMVAPSMDVDTFWHYHILDTMKYARDCEDVFGHFLHHFPYVGLRGEDDLAVHEQVGERMAVLYEATFREKYQPNLISAAAADTASDFPASAFNAATAYSMHTTGKAATAYSMHTTGKAATAYSMHTTDKAATAYSMHTTDKAATAYSMHTTDKAATAYSMHTTDKAATAYSMHTTDKAATAYSMHTTDKAATAYSMHTTDKAATAYSMHTTDKAATAYSMHTTGGMNQDETGVLLRSGGTAFSKDPAETVEDDGILMNMFFLTRPRLPAQAKAN